MNFLQLKHQFYSRIQTDFFQKNITELRYSDMVLHLPVLEYYSSLCNHVTEFGVREGNSTLALLAGAKHKVVSYDIQWSPIVQVLRQMALPCNWEFFEHSTIDPKLQIEETDLLFIDTLHYYEHVQAELALHGNKAKRFLAFHDTYTCGKRDASGEDSDRKGILPAIEEYCTTEKWHTVYRTNACNGLWILERIATKS